MVSDSKRTGAVLEHVAKKGYYLILTFGWQKGTCYSLGAVLTVQRLVSVIPVLTLGGAEVSTPSPRERRELPLEFSMHTLLPEARDRIAGKEASM